MKCKNCNIEDTVKYSKYSNGEFCSRECARSFTTKEKRLDINKAVSLTLKGLKRDIPKIEITCWQCTQKVLVKLSKAKQKFCSVSCSSTWLNLSGRGRIAGLASVKSQGNKKRSKNEIYFGKLCQDKFKSVKFNESIFNNWDADVIINDLKLAVLWNGKWHYEKITDKHSVEQVQNRDKIKLEEITKKGYQYYIIKDMGKFNKKFVENKFSEMLVFLKLI